MGLLMFMILAFLEQFSAARPQNEWYQQSNKCMTGVYIILPQITATTTVLLYCSVFKVSLRIIMIMMLKRLPQKASQRRIREGLLFILQ